MFIASRCMHLSVYECFVIYPIAFYYWKLRQKLGIEDMITVLQCNGLRWYGNISRKDKIDWMKRCVADEMKCLKH